MILQHNRQTYSFVFLSSEGFASLGIFISLTGITLSTIMYSAQSIPYFFSIGLGFLFAIPLVIKAIKAPRKKISFILFISFLPISILFLQLIFFNFIPNVTQPSLLFSIALTATMMLALAVSLLSDQYFRLTMTLLSISHVAICIHGILSVDMSLFHNGPQRFSAYGVGTSVWAEFAVGALVAAILSQRNSIVLIATLIGSIVIFKTQMRGAGISIFILITIYYFFKSWRNKPSSRLILFFLALLPLIVLLSSEVVQNMMGAILLLHDEHRGIDSGFSGRFDNWNAAFQLFLNSPLIGVGVSDHTAGGAHNGLIKAMAQMGLFFFIPFSWLIATSTTKAWRNGHMELFAAIFCYLVFILSEPRYINLQIMPFVGLVAVIYSYVQTPLKQPNGMDKC